MLLLVLFDLVLYIFWPAEKNSSDQFFSLLLVGLMIILSRFNGNTILSLSTAVFKLVVCLPIGLLNFCSRYGKLFPNFIFSETSTDFQKRSFN